MVSRSKVSTNVSAVCFLSFVKQLGTIDVITHTISYLYNLGYKYLYRQDTERVILKFQLFELSTVRAY